MLTIKDISNEKRMKSTRSRYMDPNLADKLLAGGDEILGGQSVEATVLFSDIRAFTTLTEELGPQGTVALLYAVVGEEDLLRDMALCALTTAVLGEGESAFN